MLKNPEIDRLRDVSDRASAATQAAYEHMKALGQRRSEFRNRMDTSWNEVTAARNEMNSAFERKKFAWAAYKNERNNLSTRIDEAARQADYAHNTAKDATDNANRAYASGDKASAGIYAQSGRDYRQERDSYNAEKSRLISIAKSMTPPYSDFDSYKSRHDELKARHIILQSEYQTIKSQHEAARAEFNQARERSDAAKSAFRSAIKAEKAKRRTTKCVECGVEIRYTTDYDNVPKRCKKCKEKSKQASVLYDRRLKNRDGLEPIGASGIFAQRDRKVGHSTQYYSDGTHVSWDTDGENDFNTHWTDQKKDRHDPKRHW
jgi:predicted  nucleic acid-binding Zn-ribbon protein